ncbi:MAG: nuclear transport factor 2 family protein [Chloroflexi bacterium]|nr:nuclear transport factor 2 family protein [Chloroflexota bacterium]
MDTHHELIERWQAWQRSIERRDVEAARGFLADDYALELVQPARAVMPREAWLGMLPDYIVSGYQVEDQIIDVDGGLAVILHRAGIQATVYGADRSGTFVVTDVWRRRDGRWLVWRRHSTPLEAGALPAREQA